MRHGHKISWLVWSIRGLAYYPDNTKSIRRASLSIGVCIIRLSRTIEAYLRFEVILFVIVLLLFLGFCFISCTRSHGKWKEVSENDEDVAGFFVTPCIMVLSLCDLVVVNISVEMSDSSDISSPYRVPVEVAKSRRCSTGVDSLGNLLFPLSSCPCPSRFWSMTGSGWTSTYNIDYCSSEDFWFLVSIILPETFFPLSVPVRVILSTKVSFIAFLCFVGMNFLELSPSLSILDLSWLDFNLSLLTVYTPQSIANVLIVWLLIIIKQHNKFQRIHLNSDHESF